MIHSHFRSTALGCVVAVGSACVEDLPLDGGNQSLFPAEACPIPTANAAWTSASIAVERRQPDRCPFSVAINSAYMAFGFTGRVSKSNVVGAQVVSMNLVDWQGYSRESESLYWTTDPNDSYNWIAIIDVNALPGNVIPDTDGNLQDTARFDTYTVWGTATSSLVLNGKANLMRGTLIGPTAMVAAATEYFRAEPAMDTSAYYYSWTLDGMPISGASDASELITLNTVGTHHLKVFAERTDLTVDTISKTITVTIGSSFTGPSVLEPYVNYQWTVSAVGGTAPHTFEWYLDASFLQGGTSFSGAFNANESHWFDVKVTDALNNVGWSSFNFYSTNGGGGEGQLRSVPSSSPPPRRRPGKFPSS